MTSSGTEHAGSSDDTVVQECVVEGETDECIDTETDVNDDFFETGFEQIRGSFNVPVSFFTVSKASFKAFSLSVMCFASFIWKTERNGHSS